MKTNNIILTIFILIFFSACYKKIDNTSLNADYKILNQVSVVGTLKNVYMDESYKKALYGIRFCRTQNKEDNFWLNSIIDEYKFHEILEAKGIEVLDFGEPVKRLIFIKPFYYTDGNIFKCTPDSIIVDIFLYDVENISKTWVLKSCEDIVKEMGLLKEVSDLLKDKNIIYATRYSLDENFNSVEIYELDYGLDKTNDRDVKKFFNKVVEDLGKVVRFPYSLNH